MALSTVFHLYILPTTLRTLTLFFKPYFCLTGPFQLYISLWKSPSALNIIPFSWLGLKHQLTNYQGEMQVSKPRVEKAADKSGHNTVNSKHK